ncbi:hypothetical protein TRVA0_083S00254 [Trichomonascus vanleenenianus]|uniref:Stb3p n=1 Tax=Trichomonascus vanleenenianus TaxID=2268995 RepID=UPI003EC9B23B
MSALSLALHKDKNKLLSSQTEPAPEQNQRMASATTETNSNTLRGLATSASAARTIEVPNSTTVDTFAFTPTPPHSLLSKAALSNVNGNNNNNNNGSLSSSPALHSPSAIAPSTPPSTYRSGSFSSGTRPSALHPHFSPVPRTGYDLPPLKHGPQPYPTASSFGSPNSFSNSFDYYHQHRLSSGAGPQRSSSRTRRYSTSAASLSTTPTSQFRASPSNSSLPGTSPAAQPATISGAGNNGATSPGAANNNNAYAHSHLHHPSLHPHSSHYHASDSPHRTGPLNTNSPIALAAAAAVTPDKLAKLLLSQGPLAIRHITGHLALTIPGFADLSLSKQRRLIIAVLDSPHKGVKFNKVGWGRWSCDRTDASSARTSPIGDENEEEDVKPPHATSGAAAAALAANPYAPHHKSKRRESITAGLYNQHKPPMSPLLNAVDASQKHWHDDVDLAEDDMMFHNAPLKKRSQDTAVFDDDDDDDDDYDEYDDDEDYDEYGLKHPRERKQRRADSVVEETKQETDEEDWQSMGPEMLRKPPHHKRLSVAQREQEAIDALVQLSSV